MLKKNEAIIFALQWHIYIYIYIIIKIGQRFMPFKLFNIYANEKKCKISLKKNVKIIY